MHAPHGRVSSVEGVAARRLLAVAFLLLSILMISTLVLLPAGVPLALLAVALIVAPGDG